MSRTFLFVGGPCAIDRLDDLPAEDDRVIAADAGYRTAKALGVHVDLLVGDFDSLDTPEDLAPETEVVTLKPEKDLTDTQVAISHALQVNNSQFVVIGGLDGRLDHTLSCISILEYLDSFAHSRKNPRRIHCTIDNGYNRIRLLHNDSLILPKSHYRYVGLLALDKKVRKVDIEGVKYPLKNATLLRRHQYAVSNEIVGNCAFISVGRGSLFVVESSDPS